MNPLLLVDFYKPHHERMYPEGMSLLYSNFTPRKSRIKGVNEVVFFGLQHFILKYLIKEFDKNFFGYDIEDTRTVYPEGSWYKNEIIADYKRHINIDTKHIEDLWDLGYLPIEIKALPEGTLCPIGVPCLTIKNTHPDFAWLVNYLETLISCMLWQPITSATIANEYRKLLEKYAKETTGSIEGVQWQAHDFSMRGMSSPESAILSGMAHLTSFTGTDTIPAIYQLEESYNASGLIGASVPATEHSVMCMGQKESEIDTFRRLLNLYPEGILSVVSDTWDLWKVLTEYLPTLKKEILSRNGKLVIRPDSGDPVEIICGHEMSADEDYEEYRESTYYKIAWSKEQYKGVIELLWDVFGGTINEQGYKVLDPHIGAIYGDSITLERAEEICERLKAKGFASTNIVFGVGSYTYQYNTRDTFGFAMKATYGEITEEGYEYPVKLIGESSEGTSVQVMGDPRPYKKVETREIFKDPITDDGTKKSKKGLLRVDYDWESDMEQSAIIVKDQQTWEQENDGLLQTVFKDGKLVKQINLEEIRNRIKNN